MRLHRGTLIRSTGLLAALLALIGSLSAADEDCVPKTCCPLPTTTKTPVIVYGETVKDVCFPPTPCMRLKQCLGLAPNSGCDGCSGSPRKVHKLTSRVITEEKCSTKYEPVVPCPKAPCPDPPDPAQDRLPPPNPGR
jgi:hypothetical protein